MSNSENELITVGNYPQDTFVCGSIPTRMPVEKINWDKHDVVTCDERGRATLGSEYADEKVFVYVAEMPDVDELAEEPVPDEISDVLGKMLKWADDNDIETMTHLLDPETGVVTDKQGNEHQSPHTIGGDSDE